MIVQAVDVMATAFLFRAPIALALILFGWVVTYPWLLLMASAIW